MKSVIKSALICALLVSANSTFSSELLPTYFVNSDKADATLKKTEAVFVFKFNLNSSAEVREKSKPIPTEIKLSDNGKEQTLKRDKEGKISLTVKPGKHKFKIYYSEDYFEITTDSIPIRPAYRKEIELNFMSSKYPVVAEKPVIYVYPTQKTEVKISLNVKGNLGFTYPTYKNDWSFAADPDGTISIGAKKYSYLFWEGETGIEKKTINSNEGFIVEKNNIISFLEEKLSAMGLNSKEQADFITYWAPQMVANERNFVHFLFNSECDEYASLNISPRPDELYRVFMLWSKAEGNAFKALSEQKLPVFNRSGFTVLEWGGAKLPVAAF